MWAWLRKLLYSFRRQDPSVRPFHWPTREEILALPPFEAIAMENIIEVTSGEGARRAYEELIKETVVGFDTESKPVFVRGHVSTGPHVAQFATLKRAYVFSLHSHDIREAVRALLRTPDLKKVGFGLSEDLRLIPIKLGVQPKSVVDLESVFKARGHGRGVGVKVAVAIALKRRFTKSKRASTSNWMRRQLSEAQLVYAANDAYAAMRVYEALGRPR